MTGEEKGRQARITLSRSAIAEMLGVSGGIVGTARVLRPFGRSEGVKREAAMASRPTLNVLPQFGIFTPSTTKSRLFTETGLRSCPGVRSIFSSLTAVGAASGKATRAGLIRIRHYGQQAPS